MTPRTGKARPKAWADLNRHEKYVATACLREAIQSGAYSPDAVVILRLAIRELRAAWKKGRGR